MRRFSLYEPVDFIASHLKDKLEWRQVRDSVAVHVPCSSKKMGSSAAFEAVAGLCAKEVTPSGIPCCGARPSRLPPFRAWPVPWPVCANGFWAPGPVRFSPLVATSDG